MNQKMRFKSRVSTRLKMMQVAIGKCKENFSLVTLKSPGNFPKEIPSLFPRSMRKPKTKMPSPIKINHLARLVDSIATYTARREELI
jgi:hypothetical protein